MQADLAYTPPLPGSFVKYDPYFASDQPTRLILDWEDASYADSYEICYDDDPNGSCTGAWSPAGSDSRSVLDGLEPGTAYEWQVRARNSNGVTEADDGMAVPFDTADHAFSGLSYLPLLTRPPVAPGVFSKSSPTSGQTNVPLAPTTLTWESAANASSYAVCYDSTLDGQCTGSWVPTGMNTQISLKELGTWVNFEWQVKALNDVGETLANAGSWWTFRTYLMFLPNGNFDAGAVAWTQYSSNGFPLIVDATVGGYTYKLARLGGANLETSSLSQRVTVPLQSYRLAFSYWIQSAETTTICFDRGEIFVNGSLIHTRCLYGNDTQWNTTNLDLYAWAGETILLEIRGTTNGVNVSTWYVDSMGFTSLSYAPPLENLWETFPDLIGWIPGP
jgi:hypothetical protein